MKKRKILITFILISLLLIVYSFLTNFGVVGFLIFDPEGQLQGDENVVLLLHMDGDVLDSSGKGNNGNIVGGVNCGVVGKFGRGCEFNGVGSYGYLNDYIDLNNMDVSGGEMTISLWFRADDLSPSDVRLISKSTGTDGQSHYWMVSSIGSSDGRKLRFRLKTGSNPNSGTTTLIADSGNLELNTWTHAVATYDGAEMKLYKDGVKVGSVAKTGTLATNSDIPVWIGRNPDGYGPWDGMIDEVVIFNRALSSSEILDLYNAVPGQAEEEVTEEVNETEENVTEEIIEEVNETGENVTEEIIEETEEGEGTFVDEIIYGEEIKEVASCVFEDVYWADLEGQEITKSVSGQTVYLTVEAQGCDGKEVDFTILETDGIFGRSEEGKDLAVIENGIARKAYRTIWKKDKVLVIFNGGDPDLIFNAETNPEGESEILVVSPSVAGAIVARINASRVNCVAPCAVFFEGTESTDSLGRKIGDSNANPTGEGLLGNDILEYTWDFGDGTNFSGFNAAHVYESDGTFTVRLTIRDKNGVTSMVTQDITVVPEDSLETFCLSNDDDFTGCPAGATLVGPTTTVTNIGSDRRILLKRGDSYNGPVNFGSNTNVVLGAYGNCQASTDPEESKRGICANAPIISAPIIPVEGPTIDGNNLLAVTVKNVRIIPGSTMLAIEIRWQGGAWSDILFLRVSIEDYKGMVLFSGGGNVLPDKFFFVDSILKDAAAGNMFYVGGRLALINTELGPGGNSHNLYGSVIDRGVITGNYFHDPWSGGVNLRVGSNIAPGSRNVIVSDNEFDKGGNTLSLHLAQTSNNPVSWITKNILIEKNYFHNMKQAIKGDRSSYENVVVRNNVFKLLWTGDGAVFQIATRGHEPNDAMSGVRIYGNTIFSAMADAAFKIDLSDAKDIEIFNNIIYGTSASSSAGVIRVNDPFVMNEITSNNNLFYYPNKVNIFSVGGVAHDLAWWQGQGKDQDSFIDDPSFVVDPPVNPDDFKLKSTSPAKDQGAPLDLVYEDYDKVRRPFNNLWDIGAFEFTGAAPPSQLAAVINASRVNCVAPCAVFFEGTNSKDANGYYIGDSTTQGDPNSRGLLGNDILEYTWDFGDGETFSGFNAAKVYETLGSYIVRLTIRDINGESFVEEVIDVQAFSGTTICRSTTNDFTGCPSGATQEVTNAYSGVGPNTKVLYKRGDTFTYSIGQSYSGSNIIIGAFPETGSLASRPFVQYTGTASFEGGAPIRSGTSEISVVDIRFKLKTNVKSIDTGAINLLFLRTEIDQYYDISSWPRDLTFYVDSVLNDAFTNLFYAGSRLVLMNTTLGNARDEHNLYGSVIDRGVITGNYFHDAPFVGLRIAGNQAPGSWNVVVSDNEFESNSAAVNLVMTTPGSPYSGHNILIERNYIHDVQSAINNQRHGYTDVIIRNNLMVNNRDALVLHNADRPDTSRAVRGLRFYGNTIVSSDLDDEIIKIRTSDHEDVEIKNNIFYQKGLANVPIIAVAGGIDQVTSNNNLFYYPDRANDLIFEVGVTKYNITDWRTTIGEDALSIVADPSLMVDSPSVPDDFKLQSGSLAIDKGASLLSVFEDYDRVSRPQGLGWDIGAFEFTGALPPSQLAAVIIPSRTTCTSPCAVFFEGTESTDANGRKIGDSNGGEGLLGNDIVEYVWDFGDGTNFSGFNAAHVYEPSFLPAETEKQITATLKVIDINDAEHTTSVSITIQNPDVVFVGVNTICRADITNNGGDWSGCPAGATQQDTGQYTGVSANTRVLYRRGDTFSHLGGITTGSNAVIGAFGDCAQYGGTFDARGICSENPLIQFTGSSGSRIGGAPLSGGNSLIAMDLRIHGNDWAATFRGSNNQLMLRTVHTNYYQNTPPNRIDGLFIVNSNLINAEIVNLYYVGSRLALMNTELGPAAESHNLYGSVIDRSVITGNYFHDSLKHGLRIAANAEPGSWNVVVSDNEFDRNGFSSINLKETSGSGFGHGGHNLLIERNDIMGYIDNQDDGYTDIVIRNNILNRATFFVAGNAHIGIDGLRIYGNTFRTTGNSITLSHPDQSDIDVANNIILGSVVVGGGTSTLTFNNNLCDDVTYCSVQGDPQFINPNPTIPEHFKLKSTSPARDEGVQLDLVYEDYDKVRRPQGLGWDIGAFELEGPISCVNIGDCNYLDNVCSDWECDTGAQECVPTFTTNACEDNNECTINDVCGNGFCGGINKVDNIPCTDNLLFCDGTESCQAGSCVSTNAPVVDDGFSCTVDSCDEANDVVVNTPDNTVCDDGNSCTTNTCVGSGGDVTGCLLANVNAGILCDDGVSCTTGETCDGLGSCVAGTADDSLCLPIPDGCNLLSNVCDVNLGCTYTPVGCDVVADLVAHWKFDESSGVSAADSSGNNHVGTLIGGASFVSDPTRGNVLNLDGVDDYVSSEDNFDIVGSEMTITAWVEDVNAHSEARIVSKALSTGSHWWMLGKLGGEIRVRLQTDTGTTTLFSGCGSLTPGSGWTHVAMVYDGAVLMVYQDGSEVCSVIKTGVISTSASAPVWIGANPIDGYGPWGGGIDDVRIYSRALTQGEISDIMLGVQSVCGDGIIEGSEQCEGSDFGIYGDGVGQCSSYGSFVSGDLQCTSCVIDTSGCVAVPCSLTSANWNPIGPVFERNSVNLEVVGNNCLNEIINYTVYRSIWWWFDPVVMTSETQGSTSWLAGQKDDGTFGTGTFYFEAESAGGGSGIVTSGNLVVDVAPPSSLAAKINASRTTCTSPCAVFFEGTESTDANGFKIGDSNGGEGLLGNDIVEYAWDFGDGETFSGFNAAHVYETVGQKTVSLTIRDVNDLTSTITETIDVQAFSGETYCVSSVGDFSDCPGEGASDVNYQFSSYDGAFNAIASNSIVQPGDRVLFKRGDTFNFITPINFNSAQSVLIGAYGNCINPDAKGICANNPLIQYAGIVPFDGTGAISAWSTTFDISIMDIRINSTSTVNGVRKEAFVLGSQSSNPRYMLFLRMLFEDYYTAGGYPDHLFIVNSTLGNAELGNLWFGGSRLALINNELGPAGSSHTFYGFWIDRGVFSGNYWHDSPKVGIRLSAQNALTYNVVVSDNEIARVDAPIVLGSSTADLGNRDGHNILIERNYIHDSVNVIKVQRANYSDIIIRNNIIANNDRYALLLSETSNPNGPVGGVKRLKFYGNTIIT